MNAPVVIDIHARMPDGALCAVGQIAFGPPSNNSGQYRAEFRYAREWIDNPHGYDLDPRNLPRSVGTRSVSCNGLRPAFGCLDDALPDAWGRSLFRDTPVPAGTAKDAHLMIQVGGAGLGTLAFAKASAAPSMLDIFAVRELAELLDAAQRFERHEEIESRSMARLLAAGGTPGGARPKALVRDDLGFWLAKFPSVHKDDGRDIVGMEAASLQIARNANLTVPDHRVVPVGAKRVLLVRRFDIAGTGGNGRHHMISMATLMQETASSGGCSYIEVGEQLRKYSGSTKEDVEAFFRQMVFNAAIGNTDDHLRNFRLIHRAEGWRLAPAYDLLPDVGRLREHAMAFLYERSCPTSSDLVTIAHRWGIGNAVEIIDEVCEAVSKFVPICEEFGVPQNDRDFFGSLIERRISTISGKPIS